MGRILIGYIVFYDMLIGSNYGDEVDGADSGWISTLGMGLTNLEG